MKRIALVVLASGCLMGCTPAAPDVPDTRDTPASAAPAVADCGTFTMKQGERFPGDGARCLIEATQAGRPALLRVTRPTVEGDPIHFTYEARDGRVEVVTDSREDGFGAKEVVSHACTGPTFKDEQLDFATCSEPSPAAPK
jgi:uncharacterized protein DUF4362